MQFFTRVGQLLRAERTAVASAVHLLCPLEQAVSMMRKMELLPFGTNPLVETPLPVALVQHG